MIERRQWLTALGALVLGAPYAAFAQQNPGRIFRIGWLGTGSGSVDNEFLDDLRNALRDLGRNPKSIVFERRDAEFRPVRLPALAAELVALKPDVIIAGATPGTRAAREATSTIPIVMIGVADPVGAGFVDTLARPGGNVTGVANRGLDMAAKPLDLLHAVVPKAMRVGVLHTTNPMHPAITRELEMAGKAYGLTMIPVKLGAPDEIDNAFALMTKERAQALVVVDDSVTITHGKRIAELAAQLRLPTIYSYAIQVEAGGLMSYGPNPRNLHKVVARYVDRILKGAKPADLPVEQPSEFELVLNLKAAKALGLTFPKETLLRADRTLE